MASCLPLLLLVIFISPSFCYKHAWFPDKLPVKNPNYDVFGPNPLTLIPGRFERQKDKNKTLTTYDMERLWHYKDDNNLLRNYLIQNKLDYNELKRTHFSKWIPHFLKWLTWYTSKINEAATTTSTTTTTTAQPIKIAPSKVRSRTPLLKTVTPYPIGISVQSDDSSIVFPITSTTPTPALNSTKTQSQQELVKYFRKNNSAFKLSRIQHSSVFLTANPNMQAHFPNFTTQFYEFTPCS